MPMLEDFASCGACRFQFSGECRRNAPAIERSTGKAIWPLVAINEWCGEFRRDPRKAAPAMEPA